MTVDDLVTAARGGDTTAFDRLVAPFRNELRAHCYRMLGGVHDADDAVQDALLGAWRGLAGFEGRAALRSWLYRIATNTCLRQLRDRPKRLLSADYFPAAEGVDDLGEPQVGKAWLEPYPSSPEDSYEQREGVELAFVAALQHLPATQRAVLILRVVLGYSAAEVADVMDTSVASVNSALQRARKTLDERMPSRSQQGALAALGDDGHKALVARFVEAWERADVPALVGMLTEDARLTMPPLPIWLDGADMVALFLRERIFATPWRVVPATVNGQLGFAAYQGQPDGTFALGGVNVLTVRGDRVSAITSFLDPAWLAPFDLPEVFPADR
ncbi:sigma-70 family RNA polymerase sigma factor [Actinophytocola sp. KF-1]